MSDIERYLAAAREATASLNGNAVRKAAELCVECIGNGGTVFFCGNGGSAADSQHFAGELVGRFRMDRRALPAVAITANSAVITAIANDYDYSLVFSRQVEALGRPGDLLVGISTSGGSMNVIKAMEKAREMGMKTIGFTGAAEGAVGRLSDVCVSAESPETSHVQEALLIAGHAVCDAVEKAFRGRGDD
ncbi:MAG: SIS domain-containing protein [Candidatus Aegiribacteria sp.]